MALVRCLVWFRIPELSAPLCLEIVTNEARSEWAVESLLCTYGELWGMAATRTYPSEVREGE